MKKAAAGKKGTLLQAANTAAHLTQQRTPKTGIDHRTLQTADRTQQQEKNKLEKARQTADKVEKSGDDK